VPAEFDGISGPAFPVASSLKPAEPPVTVPAEPAAPAAAPPPAPAANASVLYRAKAVASAIVMGFMAVCSFVERMLDRYDYVPAIPTNLYDASQLIFRDSTRYIGRSLS
jgi:hypothetical protein